VDVVTTIGGLVNTLLSKFFPDKDAQQKQAFILELQARLGELDLAKGQIDINKAEAENPNRTWITWRELLGYMCVAAFGWSYLLQPVLTFLIVTAGYPRPDLPALDMAQLTMLLLTMLGYTGLRTIEKVKGVTK
jgi:hypothetical protein